jgi:hypothetical protein
LATTPHEINSGTTELIDLPSRGDCRISNIEDENTEYRSVLITSAFNIEYSSVQYSESPPLREVPTEWEAEGVSQQNIKTTYSQPLVILRVLPKNPAYLRLIITKQAKTVVIPSA